MKVTFDQLGDEARDDSACVFVISDSLGESAHNVVLSAASQFSNGAVKVVRLSKIESAEDVRSYLDEHDEDYVSSETAVFHSIVDPQLRGQVRAELNSRAITSVDILGPVVQLLSSLTGERPKNQANAHHLVDRRYLRRVAAMEFFADHDDGKNPADLPQADVVLVGLTGSAKTPLAMHLSFLGYRVASVSLDPGCEVPSQLFETDPRRVFGLMTTTDALAAARSRADGSLDPQAVFAEVEEAQLAAAQVMDKLGCACIRTDEKTVEDLSGDIVMQVEAI